MQLAGIYHQQFRWSSIVSRLVELLGCRRRSLRQSLLKFHQSRRGRVLKRQVQRLDTRRGPLFTIVALAAALCLYLVMTRTSNRGDTFALGGN